MVAPSGRATRRPPAKRHKGASRGTHRAAPGRANRRPPPTPFRDSLSRLGEYLGTHAEVITFAVVAAAALFVFVQLHPRLIFSGNTATGGDTGSQVWAPAFFRDHLLPHGRLTGWSPDWYAGFPAYFFYFPVPAVMVTVLDLVLPYNVAFKMVTASGLIALPVAAWAFGRLSGMRFPGPAVLAVATVPYLFYYGFKEVAYGGAFSNTIYGGNIAAAMAGEFSFSISLALALVFLGVVAKSLDTGRYRATAAVLLALTGMSHVLPTLFALAGVLVLLLLRPGKRRLGLVATVLGVGAALAALWWFPFLMRLQYANNMGFEKRTNYRELLFPYNLKWLLILAALGAIVSVAYRRRTGLVFVGLAAISFGAFVLMPDYRLWNARMLPFWYLSLFLLAGVFVAELGGVFSRLLADDPTRPVREATLATPVIAALAVYMLVGHQLGIVPSWATIATVREMNFSSGWAQYNYSGYEGKPAYPEYRELMLTMRQVGAANGCGRVHWEYAGDAQNVARNEGDLNRFGSPMALMLLPYWTDGCMGSMEGLYFESSATTPYHFLTAAELSRGASNPQRRLPYPSFNVADGVNHLKILGARYYLAFSTEAVRQAKANGDLELVATGPPAQGVKAAQTEEERRDPTYGRWHVFEIQGSELVTPLAFEPAVLDNYSHGEDSWRDVAVDWFLDPSKEVFLAESGPDNWPRTTVRDVVVADATARELAGATVEVDDPQRKPLPPVTVSNVRTDDDRISFDVDKPGTPVLVKTSFFPNWDAQGAAGPWRVTPNLMVVVPTERHVELHFGFTTVDIVGWWLTGLGLVGVFVLARRPPVDLDEPTPDEDAPFEEGDERFESVFRRGGDTDAVRVGGRRR